MFEVKKELLESHEALLTVDVDAKAFQKGMQKAARKIAREVHIPGFRKGKAPYNVVLRRFGEEMIKNEAAEIILDEIYPQVLEQAAVEPYAAGGVEEMQLDPVSFKIRVPLAPEVDLGDYLGLRLDKEAVVVTDEDLEQALEHVRKDKAILAPVDRPAELGDVIVLSELTGEIDEDETLVHEHGVEILLDVEDPYICAEFIEALVGLSAGEEKSFDVLLPEDFEEEDLRDVVVDFFVEVETVNTRTLPELDDALASAAGNFETFEELRADLVERILAYKEQIAAMDYRDALVEALVAQSEVRYPPQMLEEELDDVVEDVRKNLQKEHQLSLEDYLRLQGKTLELLREELSPVAESRLTQGLVLSEFALREQVQVSLEEVQSEIDSFILNLGLPVESAAQMELTPDSQLGKSFSGRLAGVKVLKRLEQIGLGQADAEPEAEDAASEPVEAEVEAVASPTEDAEALDG